MQDVLEGLPDEVQWLLDQGVPYLQLDNPHYPDYIEESRRQQWRTFGDRSRKGDPRRYRCDNACIAGVDRANVTVATHICRGNGRSAWHTQGGYEPIAEQLFSGLASTRSCSNMTPIALAALSRSDSSRREERGLGADHDQDRRARVAGRAAPAHRGGLEVRPDRETCR